MTTKNPTPARKPIADYKNASVTPLIQEYADWLTANTGVKVDPLSVFLGSALRSRFQEERREAKTAKPATTTRRRPANAPAAKPAKPAAKAAAKTPSKPARRRAATVATEAGAVIAEQRHVDATKEAVK